MSCFAIHPEGDERVESAGAEPRGANRDDNSSARGSMPRALATVLAAALL
jgi:hypothetical protein